MDYGYKTWRVTTLADRLFADNRQLISVTIPESVTSTGAALFDGCDHIAAIVWGASTPLTHNIAGNIENPNMLVYVTAPAYAPNFASNIVVGNEAESIVLQDVEGNGNFYCPRTFTAKDIRYTHTYSLQTPISGCEGWETIALPFAVQTIVHKTKGEAAPFAKGDATAKPFWLSEYSASGFMRSASIEAYTPYVIAMPNNDHYIEDYILAGEVTFLSENVLVEEDHCVSPESGTVSLKPNFIARERNDSIYALNINGEDGIPAGSTFVQGLRSVRPFEAYATNSAPNASHILSISDMGGEITGINDVVRLNDNDRWGNDKVYDLSGRKILNSMPNGQLRKGLYIINGKKRVIR